MKIRNVILSFEIKLQFGICRGVLAGGGTPPPSWQFLGCAKGKGGTNPAPNFESAWEETHSKKYSYFREEKMCL
jgi:hypothetical protein